jgi:hypothetical protein
MATATLELTKPQKKLLKAIEQAGMAEPGYLMVDRGEAQPLHDAEYITLNENITDGSFVAARLRTAEDTPTDDSLSAEAEEGVELLYALISDIPMAELKRGGKKPELYPFSRMSIGDSFLVPVDAKSAEPWRTFASTVSSANRRFKTDNRKFALRRVTKGDTYPNGYVEPNSGARVFRTA